MADDRLIEAVSRWNPWGKGPWEIGIEREALRGATVWLARPEVLAICGIRRCGKSTLMRQLAQALIDRGAPAKDILFVNLEEPVFLSEGLTLATLDRVFEAYRQLLRPGRLPHVFLDEVQNIPEWARWVRSLGETKRARFVVGGSSSRLLAPEVATVLTGRNFTLTLWPLSFREFLSFRGMRLSDEADLVSQGSRVREELADYLRFGGLPEVVLAGDEGVKEALLKQYFRDILYRDVVTRHQVRDVRALERLAHHHLVNTANLSTHNRLKNAYGLAMDQVRSYTAFLQESYLVREMPRFSHKASAVARAPRKVYASDTGLRNAVAFRFSEDLGRVAETAVHNQLARDEDTSLFYHSDRHECDFVVWKGTRATAAIQVCYAMDDALPEREIAGLVEAMTAHDLREGTLVTRDTSFERAISGRTVRARPLWRWLLDRGEPGPLS